MLAPHRLTPATTAIKRRPLPSGWISACVALFLMVVGIAPALATNGTWIDTTSGGLWSTTGNWSGGIVANGTDGIADFSTLNITADDTIHLNSARTIGQLKFGDTTPSNNWILDNNGTAFDILTLAVSSGSPSITVNNDRAVISARLAGTQGITKSGAGELLLNDTDTFTGSVAINAGTLALGNASSLGGTANAITVGTGATLDLGGQAIGANPLTISGTGVGGNGALINSNPNPASYAGNITLNAASSVGGAGDITLSGSVNGADQVLTKIGNNTLTLSGTTDNNSLAVTVNSGTVVLAKTSSSGAHAIGQDILTVNGGTAQLGGTGGDQIYDLGSVTVTSGSFDTNGRNETFANLSLQGAGIGGSGALVNSAAAFSAITPTGGTTLTGNATIGVTQSTGELQLNNAIGGNFALSKVGAGTLLLAGNNTFTGGVVIHAGTLALGNAGALGSNAVNVNTGATLDLGGQAIGANALTISGTGVGGNGALINSSANAASYAGNIIGNNGPASIGGTGQITLSGSVSNSMPPNVFPLTKIGGNTLILSGTTDNFNLAVAVNSGTVILAKTSSSSPDVHAIGQPGLTINGGLAQIGGTGGDQIYDLGSVTVTSGSFDTNGRNETFANLSLQGPDLGGAGALVNSAAAFSAITPTGGTTLTGNATIGVTQSTGELQLNNAIGGNFALTKTGLGTLDLEGTNTFSGGLAVQQGTLSTFQPINNASTNGVLGNNSSVTLGSSGQTGTIEVFASGTTNMPFTLAAGGTGAFSLVLGTNLQLSGAIGGTGALLATGGGTLTLSGSNTFTGGVTIQSGTLRVGSATALGSTANNVSVSNGATLDLAGQAIGANPMAILGAGVGGNGALINSSANAASYAGNIIGNNGPASIGGTGQITLSGSVSNSMPPNVFPLTKIGGNTLILSGTTDNFNLAVAVNSGTVILAKTSSSSPDVHAIGQPGLTINGGLAQIGGTGGDQIYDLGSVTVTSGSFDTNGRNETFANLSLQGPGLGGAGALVNSAAAFSAITPTGGTTLTGNATIGVTQSTGELQLNNAIAGNFALTKTGSGTLLLSGNNTFTGGSAVGAGTLALGNAGALGSNSVNVTNGATLDLGGQAIGANPLTISGTGVGGIGALVNSSAAAASFAGTVTANGPFTVGGTGDITLSGSVNGANQALTKIGNNTLTLSGTTDNNSLAVTVNSGTVVLAKTSSGSPNDVHAIGQDMLTVNGGTAQLGGTGGDQIFDLGSVTVTSGSFDTNGRNETFATFFLQGTGIANAGALRLTPFNKFSTITPTNGTLLTGNATIGVDFQSSALTLNNAVSGNFTLTKTGLGTLYLTGTNTFNGGLNIQQGVIFVPTINNAGTNGPLGNNTFVTLGSSGQTGAVDYQGSSTSSNMPFVLAAGGTGAFELDLVGATVALNGAISGSGGLAKTGGTGTLSLNANNTFTGGVTITGGTLQLGNPGALNSSTPNAVAFGFPGIPDALSLNGNSVTVSGLTAPANPATTVVQDANALSAVLTVNNSAANTFAGTLQNGPGGGSLGLTKSGSGPLTLSGPNTFTGGVTINGGDLQLGNPGALNSSAPNAVTFTAGSAGILSLSGNSVTVSGLSTGTPGGTPVVQNGVSTPATLTVGNASDNTFAGALLDGVGGGALSLVKSGAGTLTLSGSKAYTGNTRVIAGTLRFALTSGSPTIGAGATATVDNGATLELAGSVSALANGPNRVNITNNSTPPGILVTGTNQQVGNIDGSGTTQVNAGSDLTANHIIQTALVISGTAGSPALVTIAAADASGNPLAASSGFALASSLEPSEPFAAGSFSSSDLLTSNGSSTSRLTLGADTVGGSNLGGSSAVPEPATLLLGLFGLAWLSCLTRRKRM